MRRKILIITPWFPDESAPADGPASALRIQGAFVREHALALAPTHDVAVVHLQDDDRDVRGLHALVDERDGAVRTIRVRRRALPVGQLRTAAHLAGAAAAVRLLRREGWRPDVLHAHVYSAGLIAVALGTAFRLPVVISEHLGAFREGRVQGWDRRIARLAFGRAGLVAPVSEDLRRHIEACGVRARFQVVPNPVDTSLFRPGPQAAGDGPLRLLTVALLNEGKGIGYLLDALAAARDRLPSLTLDIVGDGPLRTALERRTAELGLDQIVAFHGTLPKTGVAAAMAAADVFVLPSLGENLPCVVIEALASGLPVIATQVGGLPEMVDDSNGLLVPPADPAALADALVATAGRLTDYDRRAIADQAARRYSAEGVAETWDRVYASLVSTPS